MIRSAVRLQRGQKHSEVVTAEGGNQRRLGRSLRDATSYETTTFHRVEITRKVACSTKMELTPGNALDTSSLRVASEQERAAAGRDSEEVPLLSQGIGAVGLCLFALLLIFMPSTFHCYI